MCKSNTKNNIIVEPKLPKRRKAFIMQRTVYGTKFTYVDFELDEQGNVSHAIKQITINETDEKKALKKAHKQVGTFKPVKVEKVSALYILDDDIFFKYAKVKTDADATEQPDADATEQTEQ